MDSKTSRANANSTVKINKKELIQKENKKIKNNKDKLQNPIDVQNINKCKLNKVND